MPTDKVYVGSAKNLDKRWREHVDMLNNQKHFNRHLQHAWLKHGPTAFEYDIIEPLGLYDKGVYFACENRHIDRLKTEGRELFNIARAQGGWGEDTHLRKHEIAAKISATLTSLAESMTPEERRAKWGSGRRNRPLTEEHKRKTAAGLAGVPKSQSTRKKMQIAQRDRAAANPSVAANMAAIGRNNIGRTPVNAVKYTIAGITYASGCAALRALSITGKQLTRMVKEGIAYRD